MLKTISRIIIGLVFLFSGFVKAVDPVGGAIKIAEYLELVGIHNSDTISIIFAILLSTIEFIIGFQLFFGLMTKKVAFPAFLFMSFFTVLTFYIAVEEPVTDCGCFGDAIKLSNWDTFFKNLILLPFSYWIYNKRNDYISSLNKLKQSVGALAGLVFTVSISLYSLNYLPILDFRPYKVGQNIQEAMQVPEGAETAEYETTFILEKDGKQKEFDVDNYPYEDSTWVFIESKTKTLSEGYQAPIQNFIIESSDGNDMTYQLLENENPVFLVIAPKVDHISTEHINEFKELHQNCMERSYPFYVLTASLEDEYYEFDSNHSAGFDYLNADETLLKTISRGNPGLVILNKGTILSKYNHSNLPEIDDLKHPLSHSLKSLKAVKDKTLLLFFTLLLAGFIIVLYRTK